MLINTGEPLRARRWARLAATGAILGALAFGVVACSDDPEPDAGAQTTEEVPNEPAASPEPVEPAAAPEPVATPARRLPAPGDQVQSQRLADGFGRMATVSSKANDCSPDDLLCTLDLIDEMAAVGAGNAAEAREGMRSTRFPCVRRVSREYIQIMGALGRISSDDPFQAIDQMSKQRDAMQGLIGRAQECTAQIQAAAGG